MSTTDDTDATESADLETQVLWNRLQATADEMYDAAERLAYSFSIREAADASTAVMTADGNAIGLGPIRSRPVGRALANDADHPRGPLPAGDAGTGRYDHHERSLDRWRAPVGRGRPEPRLPRR